MSPAISDLLFKATASFCTFTGKEHDRIIELSVPEWPFSQYAKVPRLVAF